MQATRRAPSSITMPSGGSFPTARATMLDTLGVEAGTLRQLAETHFARPHGRPCAYCGERTPTGWFCKRHNYMEELPPSQQWSVYIGQGRYFA